MNNECAEKDQSTAAITVCGDDFIVDAELVARNLGLSPDIFWKRMRRGIIKGKVERGEGEDQGRTRLTFRYGGRSWAVVVEDTASSK